VRVQAWPPFEDEFAARAVAIDGFIDGDQSSGRPAIDLGAGLGYEAEGETIEVEGDFVGGDAVAFRGGVAANQLRIALQPGEGGVGDQHAKHFALLPDVLEQRKPGAAIALLAEDVGGIDTEQVAAVPHSVVVAGLGFALLQPGGKGRVDQERDLEMEMGAVLADGTLGVGGSAHDSDDLASANRGSRPEFSAGLTEVGIERVNLEPFDAVAQNDIDAVIGQARFAANVGHVAVGRRAHFVGGFTAAILLGGQDIDALVHLPTAGPDASRIVPRSRSCPRLARRSGRCRRDREARGWRWETGRPDRRGWRGASRQRQAMPRKERSGSREART
jgi:hypothetical protein